jgi:hypothetical protein
MEDDPGDYVEIDCDMKLREEGNFCGLISRSDIQFEMPGAKFPGNPSYCFDCTMEDSNVARLKGVRPGSTAR